MLPPKRVQTIIVKPKPEERQAMDEMFQHAKSRFEQYKADNVAVRRSVEVLQLLQPLRIACSAGTVDMVSHRERMRGELSRDAVRSVLERYREKDSLKADQLERAPDFAINDLAGDCSICLDLLEMPVQTLCRHLFCGECLRDLLNKARGAEKGTGACPLCRNAISIDQLFTPNVQELNEVEREENEQKMQDDDDEDDDSAQSKRVVVKQEKGVKVVKEQSALNKKRRVVAKVASQKVNADDEEQEEEKKEVDSAASASPSPSPSSSSSSSAPSSSGTTTVVFDSKLNQLVQELNAMRAASPNHKALIFTQYLSTMELLKQTMAANDFTYQTLEGHMTMRTRKRNLEEFRSNPQCAVFLLSMRSGAVGLTLTAASHVFILEPAINPALEQQAIGRIHRLGNVHPEVVVNYLIMEESIEGNIMEINAGKLAQLEKQKQREDRANLGQPMTDAGEDDEDADAHDNDGEGGQGQQKPRFGRHATNANVDSGAGINRVSQGSLVQDTALFRLGELEKLFQQRSGAHRS